MTRRPRLRRRLFDQPSEKRLSRRPPRNVTDIHADAQGHFRGGATSTPRITIWRKLKRLGVAQLGDGLIALPADARTREHLDWIAEEIVESGGTATVWIAQPATLTQERELAAAMAAARSEECRTVIDTAAAAASASDAERVRTVRRLRDELRRIHRRDHFPPTERDTARLAVETLAGPRTKADSPKITP